MVNRKGLKIGLSKIGISCLLTPFVMGYKRVPLPPANTIPFINVIFSLTLLQIPRNLQHFEIIKLLAIHTGIRLREAFADISFSKIILQ